MKKLFVLLCSFLFLITSAATTVSAEESESMMDSWRFEDGILIEFGGLSASYSSTYSTWKKSYGTSYYGIVSSGSTTKVAVSSVKEVGIDVSKYQGSIDWEDVASDGITFAIIRCGYGQDYESQDDAYFLSNVKGAVKNEIKIGVYLYSYATSTEAAESEAAHTLRLLEEAGLDPDDLDYPVFLDIENSTQKSLDASTLGDIAEAYCNALEEEGYAVGIYANKSWWTNYLTDERFDDWYRWSARYPTASTVTSSGVDDTDIWQFTSSGSVSGISGNVDVNFSYTTTYYCGIPETPTLKSATVSSSNDSVTVKWSSVSGATGYQVYRKTNSGSYSKVKQTTSTSYTDSSVEAGNSYTYKVRAIRTLSTKTNYSSYSGTKTVTIAATTIPDTVTLSSVTLASSYEYATVTWKKVSNCEGYQIYRASGNGYSKVKTITSNSTVLWKDTSLAGNKTYKYKVRAYNVASDGTYVYGEFSDMKSVSTSITAPVMSSISNLASGSIRIKWGKISSADGYVIYRSVNGGSYSKVKTITSNSTLQWTNLSVSPGRVYRYKIRAYKDINGTRYYSAYSSVKKITAKPGKVTISSVSKIKSRSSTVKWAAVSNATGYQVAYRIKGTSTWYYTTVATNKKTFTYLRNSSYYVKVRAYTTYNGTKYYGSWSSEKAMTK